MREQFGTSMGIISDCVCVDIFAVVVSCLIGLITYYKWGFKYWEKRNVPFIKPSIPFGTMGNPFWPSLSLGELIKNNYGEYKRKGCKHVGLYTFTTPVYMPIDIEYVKDILSKQFCHFTDRGIYSNEKDDPLSANLFNLEGSKWKNMRVKLTPTFTSGKMKMMFHILVECGKQLTDAMHGICEKNEAVDIKDIIGHYGTDVIGSTAFGIDCNSFIDPNADFQKHSRRFLLRNKCEIVKGFLAFANPSLAKTLGIVVTPREVTKFFMNIMKKTVEQRKNQENIRTDFLQILMDLNNHMDSEQRLTLEELTAQAFLFFIAGYEASSTTMTFCLFELAQNPQIQERVRDEINSVLDGNNGDITYEALKEMKYMKQVIDEVLRMYPPLPMLNRKCGIDFKIPNGNVTIEKGTAVIIPLYGLHYDPEYFPDPETFDPERFSAENTKNIKPFTYMPFGDGPRNCIALRFGLMQTGVGLALLLKNFRFSLSEKTKLPFKMNPYSFTLSVSGDIWLNVEKV